MRFLHLDISGVKFKFMHNLLYQYPDSLLAQLARMDIDFEEFSLPEGVHFNQNLKEFHIAKSPKLFDDIVLQFYITGKLHVPEYVCKDTVRQEILFWKLDTNSTCSCWEGCEIVERDVSETGVIKGEEAVKKTTKEEFKSYIWLTCESPKSSSVGMIFAFLSIIFILCSIASLVLSTVPDYQFCNNATERISISDVEDYDISDFLGVDSSDSNVTTINGTDINNTVTPGLKNKGLLSMWSFFSNCDGVKVFELVDLVCIIWFTFELLLRFFACPNKLEFAKSPLNIIDFAATFPYFVEVIVYAVAADAHYLHPGSILVFRLARTLTVLRILKLARYFEDLRILGETLTAAKQELLMLFLFVMVSLLIFSSLMYNLEKDNPGTQFTSIPSACWWGIATLTTVGYGDMVPATVAGKMVGFVTCLSGIMIMSFPVSVLVEHFQNTYKKKKLVLFKIEADKKMSKINSKKLNEEKISVDDDNPSCFKRLEYVGKSICQTKK